MITSIKYVHAFDSILINQLYLDFYFHKSSIWLLEPGRDSRHSRDWSITCWKRRLVNISYINMARYVQSDRQYYQHLYTNSFIVNLNRPKMTMDHIFCSKSPFMFAMVTIIFHWILFPLILFCECMLVSSSCNIAGPFECCGIWRSKSSYASPIRRPSFV